MGSSVSGAASASSAAAVTAVARLASLFYHDQNSCFCAVTLWSLQYAACFLSSLSQLEEAEPGSEASRSIVGTLRSSCVRSWRAGEDEVDDVRIMGNFPVREALARHRGSRGEIIFDGNSGQMQDCVEYYEVLLAKLHEELVLRDLGTAGRDGDYPTVQQAVAHQGHSAALDDHQLLFETSTPCCGCGRVTRSRAPNTGAVAAAAGGEAYRIVECLRWSSRLRCLRWSSRLRGLRGLRHHSLSLSQLQRIQYDWSPGSSDL